MCNPNCPRHIQFYIHNKIMQNSQTWVRHALRLFDEGRSSSLCSKLIASWLDTEVTPSEARSESFFVCKKRMRLLTSNFHGSLNVE